MKLERTVLQNVGMSQDLSISKDKQEFAFENYNIRIQATDDNTLLSVTNIKGPKKLACSETIKGTYIGHCVAGKYLVLFTSIETGSNQKEFIYRIDLTTLKNQTVNVVTLFEAPGHPLNFSSSTPLDTLYYYESESVQKVYWVNGWLDNPRVINITKTPDSNGRYYTDVTANDFSFYPKVDKLPTIGVKKQFNLSSELPIGVIQYFVSYFNKNGAETQIMNATSLFSIDREDRGYPADTLGNTCSFKLSISNVDTNFEYFRIYSAIRTSYDGPISAYIVKDVKINSDVNYVYDIIDRGINNETIEAGQLMFVGGSPFFAKTIEQKDNTIFFGNLKSTVASIDSTLKEALSNTVGSRSDDTQSTIISFSTKTKNIPSDQFNPYYLYRLQNKFSSRDIKTFKYRERYRFGMQFQDKQGAWSDVVWIGDVTQNSIRPSYRNDQLKLSTASFDRANVTNFETLCTNAGYVNYRLLMADADFSGGRQIKAQGVLCPTLFNLQQRALNSPYAFPSWTMRPQRGTAPYHHLEPLLSDLEDGAEIQCDATKNDEYLIPSYESSGSSSKYYITVMCPGGLRQLFFAVYEVNLGVPDHEISSDAILNNFYDASGNSVLDSDNTTLVYGRFYHDGNWQDYLNDIKAGLADKEYPLTSLPNVKELVKIASGDYTQAGNMELVLEKALNCEVAEHIGDYEDIYKGNWKATMQRLSLKNWCRWCSLAVTSRADFGDYDAPSGSGESSTNEKRRLFRESLPSKDDVKLKYALPIQLNLNVQDYKDSSNSVHIIAYDGDNNSSGCAYKDELKNKMIMIQAISSSSVSRGGKQFFVDSSIVTMNSPEIHDNPSVLNNNNLKVRIVGLAPLTASYADADIQTSTPGHGAASGFSNDALSDYRVFDNMNPLYSDLLYRDGTFKEVSDKFYLNESTTLYKMFMWHHGGSIIGAQESDFLSYASLNENSDFDFLQIPTIYSELRTKTFYNHLFSKDTVYLDASRRVLEQVIADDAIRYEPQSIKYVDNNAAFLTLADTPYIYRGEYDNLIINQTTHFITELGGNLSEGGDIYKDYPSTVRIKFSTTPHIVFDLGIEGGKFKVLPRVAGDKGYFFIDNKRHYYIRQFLGDEWENDDTTVTRENQPVYAEMIDNISQTYVSFPSYSDSLRTYPYLWIGELYENISNADLYGGYSESDLSKLIWIPISAPTPIDENVAETEGDTYYQRWDCMKTYPTTEDDINKVVDITSFMVETHLNLDERVDANRANYNIMSRPTNFNLFNPVYNQLNNLFSYNILSSSLTDSEFPQSFIWSLVKNYNGVVDSWTNTNMMNLSNCLHPITKLVNYNNTLYSLTEDGIEVINFNNKNLINSTEGPIEVANSTKVDGTTKTSFPYGTHNMSTLITERGLYFIDDNEKSLIRLNSDGPKKIAGIKMDSWFKNNIVQGTNTKANPKALRLNYDAIHKDIYLINEDSCLVYNEGLDNFTSFVDYTPVLPMFSYGGEFYSVADRDNLGLYRMFDGEYNKLFNSNGTLHDKPYYMTYRIHANTPTDKVFTNVEFIADNKTESDNLITNSKGYSIPPFDSIRAWNEYQDSTEVPLEYQRNGLTNLQQKFRTWRAFIPRDNGNKLAGNRIRNPWCYLTLKQTNLQNMKMNFHNLNVLYMV